MAHIEKKQKQEFSPGPWLLRQLEELKAEQRAAEEEEERNPSWSEWEKQTTLVPKDLCIYGTHGLPCVTDAQSQGGAGSWILKTLGVAYRQRPGPVTSNNEATVTGRMVWTISGLDALVMQRAQDRHESSKTRSDGIQDLFVQLGFPARLASFMMEFITPQPRVLVLLLNTNPNTVNANAIVICSDESTPRELMTCADVDPPKVMTQEDCGGIWKRDEKQTPVMSNVVVQETGAVLHLDRPLSCQQYRVDSMQRLNTVHEYTSYLPALARTHPLVVMTKEDRARAEKAKAREEELRKWQEEQDEREAFSAAWTSGNEED